MAEPPSYRGPDYPRIPTQGLKGRDDHPYLPDPNLVAAANAALALGMPLLLTGEAGCGKTDFAFAAAAALGQHGDARDDTGPDTGELLECYVRSDSRARDLLYHYDALRRFGDTQHGGEAKKATAQDPRPYIKLRPLGEGLLSPYLRVVLIDEIDKAPRDLPNDLLRELDQGHFEIEEIPPREDGREAPAVDIHDPATYQHDMRRPHQERKPFVVITSNVERQLPDPFLRRTVFFHIPFPGEDGLRDIVQGRFGKPLFLDRVLDIFWALRDVRVLTKKPTTSELLNWVQTLTTVFDEGAVEASLRGFLSKVGGTARKAPWQDLAWVDLPALGCLIKLREDLERLAHDPAG